MSRYSFRATRVAFVLGAVIGCGCAVAPAPIQNTNHVVAAPIKNELSVAVEKGSPVGDVIPVYVSIANGTDFSRTIVPTQVFAIGEMGHRVAPIPPGEAARLAGGANELKGALASGVVSGAAGGALGAGLGAAAGAAGGDAGLWSAIGGAIGAGQAIFSGVPAGQSRADEQANQQIQALALQPQDVSRNFTATGYVFYPVGDYREIELVLINRETGDTETIKRPWS